MTYGARRSKGRRLQTQLAETISLVFGFTIAAEPPTKPGERNSAQWVSEHDCPDIRVRRSGQPGQDVIACTPSVDSQLSLFLSHGVHGWHKVYWECKNVEALNISEMLLRRTVPKLLKQAFAQCYKATGNKSPVAGGRIPIIVVSKNRARPIAILETAFVHPDAIQKFSCCFVLNDKTCEYGSIIGIDLKQFLRYMKNSRSFYERRHSSN